jgi:hypothetical protein
MSAMVDGLKQSSPLRIAKVQSGMDISQAFELANVMDIASTVLGAQSKDGDLILQKCFSILMPISLMEIWSMRQKFLAINPMML